MILHDWQFPSAPVYTLTIAVSFATTPSNWGLKWPLMAVGRPDRYTHPVMMVTRASVPAPTQKKSNAHCTWYGGPMDRVNSDKKREFDSS